MPIRGIVLGLGLAFVALGWWRVLERRGRASGTVTARPPRGSRIETASTEVTFQVGRTSYTFHPRGPPPRRRRIAPGMLSP